jgi:KUP system potassium uptake protein
MDAIEQVSAGPVGPVSAHGAARGAPSRAMVLAALGVVFGDIGTSPLYCFKTVLDLAGPSVSSDAAMGLLSLIVWTLILVTGVKYVAVMMRIDNAGEGGILALLSLLGGVRGGRMGIVAVGLFGAALIYGDGAITPAISVLSALEGLKLPYPEIAPYVVPVSVAVLFVLFAIQPLGTGRIGSLFGPVMLVWFLALAGLGLWGVMRQSQVLAALDPRWGVWFLTHHGVAGFLVLGGVFLAVTGAEALYADMGHVGANAIRLSWYGLVLPALVLNYAGQAALILEGAPVADNVFFRLCPPGLVLPLVLLATAATVIASQSIITGAFSMTRQAIQLGWCPRMHIKQTSATGYGQIYVGFVNWTLMALTVGLTIAFQASDGLAAAYGIAVSLTMLLTTALLFIALREIWGWRLAAAVAGVAVFVIVDLAFVTANLTKLHEGGWIPLVLAGVIYGLMTVWHRGAEAVTDKLRSLTEPADQFLARVAAGRIPRVPGTAVFLTKTIEVAPPIMVWHVRQNRALHQRLVALSVRTEPVPVVADADRVYCEMVGSAFWHIEARFGFMETPDIPALLARVHGLGRCQLDLEDVTYYVGHETVLHRADGRGLPAWEEKLYAFMERNAAHVTDFFSLPRDRVVEIGRQIEI